MKSLIQMIQQCEGLVDTHDVSAWESEFLCSVVHQVKAAGGDTTRLTEKQVAVVERIFQRHFA